MHSLCCPTIRFAIDEADETAPRQTWLYRLPGDRKHTRMVRCTSPSATVAQPDIGLFTFIGIFQKNRG